MTPGGATTVRFRLGGQSCCLPLADVAELADLPSPVPVPGAPATVLGLAELRGRIVTVLDLACLMGLGSTRWGDRTSAILLAPPWSHIALLAEGPVEIAAETGTERARPEPGNDDSGGVPSLDAPRRLTAREIVRLSTDEVRRRFRTGGAS